MGVQVRAPLKKTHEVFTAYAGEADNLQRAIGSLGEPSQPLTNLELGAALARLHSNGLQLADKMLAPGSHALRLGRTLRDRTTESILCRFGERLDDINHARGTSSRTSVETRQRVAGRLRSSSSEQRTADLRSLAVKAQHCLSQVIEIVHEIIAEIEESSDFARAVPGGDDHASAAAVATSQTTSLAANHLETRRVDSGESKPLQDHPRLFVGSTVEALSVARAVQDELQYDLDVELWNQGMFQPGIPTWTRLIEVARTFDFALFVFSGDDKITSRDETSIAVRDNLLIEYGLYAGVLGQERTLFLYNQEQRPKIATDLGGITPLTYRDQRIPNLRASVGPACNQLRQVVTQLGRRQNP